MIKKCNNNLTWYRALYIQLNKFSYLILVVLLLMCKNSIGIETQEKSNITASTADLKKASIEKINLSLMSEEFPPYNFTVNNQFQGISADVLSYIIQNNSNEITFSKIEILPWARSYRLVQENPNTVLFAVTKTKEREKLFKWAGPISSAKNVLIGLKSKKIKIKSNEDILKYRIGIVRDDAASQLVFKKFQLDYNSKNIVIGTSSVPNIKMLFSGRVDLFAYDENVAKWLMKSEKLPINEVEVVDILAEGEHYFAFNKETPDEVVQKFQKSIDELRKSKELFKIQNKYSK